ncbi:TetR/AcrR family transcriptional regulator [Corynebacterium phoceense]|uniref:TetR/AcrR family transcriptional regulator n=1 Tax=Corynebacterium phoceense TaxID=1686286 RepID=UPI001E0B9ECF|nr:TetR/AcrR family transcriptional regulator [Corynebacterium phoceense]MCQ9332923.1 TetR/AcrR family transcriptional regulator [Corynebacterium phoceense]HJG44106.1 TetR/AcrR family transcriptional regulator [Corynebacterium phoceense]
MSTKPYHHGNLKGELLRVAEEIGREEGPESISIRQVTRRVGVSLTAAYRHYTD